MWYAVLKNFGPEDRAWASYVSWSGLNQLKRFRSLDSLLSPTLWQPDTKEDWNYSISQDFRCHLMMDLAYARLQQSKYPRSWLCGLILNPTKDNLTAPEGHTLLGFDLLEAGWGVSALTDCGGFPGAFENQEISESGLILTLERAEEIRRDLLHLYPEEPHADCDVWAVYEVGVISRK